ncbi:MAG TPA: hypothetical protein VEF07_07685 [Candidatus Binataceae bacterium]|nr:hypothetical protein [Candidatus Binataceae bacterium]
MKRWKLALLMVAAVILAGAPFSRASGTEPRPWLCRDKPVFSSDKPMTWEAANRGGGRWVLTFMHFDPAGGHDGFTVASTQDLRGHTSGRLEAGQWYAVALYREGSHWICPGNARESDEPSPGVVSNLCYGEDPGSCPVKLTVRPADDGRSTSSH